MSPSAKNTLPRGMRTMRAKSQEPEDDFDLEAMGMVSKRKRGQPIVDAENFIDGREPPVAVSVPTPPRDDYEAKDALSTLTRAQEIQANKDLMRRVKLQARRDKEVRERVLRLEDKPL